MQDGFTYMRPLSTTGRIASSPALLLSRVDDEARFPSNTVGLCRKSCCQSPRGSMSSSSCKSHTETPTAHTVRQQAVRGCSLDLLIYEEVPPPHPLNLGLPQNTHKHKRCKLEVHSVRHGSQKHIHEWGPSQYVAFLRKRI